MDERIPMTKAGYEKLRAELKHLETVVLPEAAERIARAREEGDLSENAEYHGARETQGMIMAKIKLLRDKLARAIIVDPAKVPRDTVALGCTVTIRYLDTGETETYSLVGAGEEDYDNNRILVTSPLAQGLVGRRVGDRVEVPVPRGKLQLEIVDLCYQE